MRIKELLKDYRLGHLDEKDEARIKKFYEFLDEYFVELKEEHHEIYEHFKTELHEFVYEVDSEMVHEAVKKLVRRDGTVGPKWTKDDTNAVAKQYNLHTKRVEFDACIFYFAMNYVYAVHFTPEKTITHYVDIALEEIDDRNVCIKDKIREVYLRKEHK